jgi:hypothetical protein
MNEHLSRKDRYGQPNRVKRSGGSVGSWSLASGIAAPQPTPEALAAGDDLPTSILRSRGDLAGVEIEPPLTREEKKPAIGDETMVRLLIPRMSSPEERRRGQMPQAPSLLEPVKSSAARDGKFESAAVAALAKLKEPIHSSAFSSTPNFRMTYTDDGQDDKLGRRFTMSGGETPASPGIDPEVNPEVDLLPTRKELFPSQRIKMTRWFYNSLLYIFVIILIYLLWWGVSDSPWGKSHGLS